MKALTNISSVDGRYANKTQKLSSYFSEYALIHYRYLIEIEWFKALAKSEEIKELPALSNDAENYLSDLKKNFSIKTAESIKSIEQITNHDVKAVEYQLKEDFSKHPDLSKKTEFIHFACTSEDINNTAYSLMLKNGKEQVLLPQLQSTHKNLSHLAIKYADIAMLSRTHGQTASPTTLGKEFANISQRLNKQLNQFKQVQILGKINGAVGNFNAHVSAYPNVDWEQFSQQMIEEQLGLTYNAYTTQIEPHDYIAEYCHALIRINTIFTDLCRDIWSYISLGYFKQKVIPGEVGSSTMPHKVNPIDFENAEGNFGIANALMDHLALKLPVSRWQRDLTDSTVLRSLGTAFGHMIIALSSLDKGLHKLEINPTVIANDLSNAWEVIAEPIQTVMRKNKVAGAYELLKEFTRGKKMNQANMQQFIQALKIPHKDKEKLLQLTPETYIGIADKLAKKQ